MRAAREFDSDVTVERGAVKRRKFLLLFFNRGSHGWHGFGVAEL